MLNNRGSGAAASPIPLEEWNMTLREQLLAYKPYKEQEESDRRLMLRYMDTFDDVLTRNNEMAHFTASAWVVNPARTKVLMAYHNLYNLWAWLGGHADGEENLLSVCLREVCEESGLISPRAASNQIYSLEILGVDAHRKRGRHVSTHVHLNVTYLIEADEREAVRCKPDENSGVRWFALEEVLDAVSEPEMRIVYQKLIDKLAES